MVLVLVEGHGDGLTLARSYRDAPEVDGFVLSKAIFRWANFRKFASPGQWNMIW